MNTQTPPPNLEYRTPLPDHEALAVFIATCSPDPATRAVAITTMVLSFWQQGSRGIPPQLPSFILVNAGDNEHDPILKGMRKIQKTSDDDDDNDKRERVGERSFGGGTPDQAPRTMEYAVKMLREHKANSPIFPPTSNWEELYHDARVVGYGDGCSNAYSKAWHPTMGLVTDKKNSIILHLDEQADQEAFIHDIQHYPKKLQQPRGIGAELNIEIKTIAVSGSITPDTFDEGLLDNVLSLSQPYFFLPHITEDETSTPNLPDLSYINHRLSVGVDLPVVTIPNLLDTPWSLMVQTAIWKRLANLPASYRYSVIAMIHQLDATCEMLAKVAGRGSTDTEKEITALYQNLFNTVLRTLALSLRFLAWHGHGMDLGEHFTNARKLLKQLRLQGSMTLRDAQRKGGFKTASDRDLVIQRLQTEGLVHLEGKTLTAVPMKEFIKELQNLIPMADTV